MSNLFNFRMAFVIALVLGAFTLTAVTAFAAPGNNGNTRPGWGFGDTNHVHTGPPGQSVNVSNSVNAYANTGGNSITGSNGGNVGIMTAAANAVVSIWNTISGNTN